MAYLSLAVFVTVTSLTAVGWCGSISGPFYMDIHEVLRCEDSGTDEVNFDSSRITRVDKSHSTYTTNFSLGYPMDEKMQGIFELSSWGNGGWKPTLTHDSKYLCEDLLNIMPPWFDVVASSAGCKDCPIPAGRLLIKLEDTRFDVNVPQFPYGKYKIIVKFIVEENLVGCMGAIYDLKPKKKQKGK